MTARTNLVRAVCGISTLALAGFVMAAAPPNLDKTLSAQLDLVAARPYDAEAHNDLGNLLVLDGRYEQAEEAYVKAIELAPASTLARFNLGVLLQQVGRPRDAAAEFRRLLEIDDRHARTYYQLGMLHDSRKQRSAALENYARAFALDPELTFPSHNPHIIDNRMATEAILKSRQFYNAPSSEMPRLYGEPERIAELMLDEPENAVETAEMLEEEPPPRAEPEHEDGLAEPRSRQPARGARVEDAPDLESRGPDRDERDEEDEDEDADSDEEVGRDEDASGRRQLTAADLDAGSSVGQAKAQGSASPRRRAAGVGVNSGAARDRRQANPGAQPAPGTTPTARPRYRPAGRASTGRLELRLLPEEPAERLARLTEPIKR